MCVIGLVLEIRWKLELRFIARIRLDPSNAASAATAMDSTAGQRPAAILVMAIVIAPATFPWTEAASIGVHSVLL